MATDDLVYTIAIDRPGSTTYATMTRMLVASLRATGFDGTIAVLGRTAALTPLGAPWLVEHRLPEEPETINPCTWKFRARRLFDAARYRTVLYLDCDSLAVADIRPLLDGDWQLAYAPEYGAPSALVYFNAYLTEDEIQDRDAWGLNAGTFAVRGDRFDEVTTAWEQIQAGAPLRPRWNADSDQAAWNRLVRDTSLRTHAFAEGAIGLPFVARRPPPVDVTQRIVHFAGAPATTQLQAMCQTFFDRHGLAPWAVG